MNIEYTLAEKDVQIMSEFINYSVREDQIAVLTLNRPQQRNAVSFQMIKELQEVLEEAKNADLKCLVITGAGDQAFCSGGDLEDFHSDLSTEEAFKALYQMKEVLYEIARFPMPTYAFLNGHAMGGGCELATACDFRYANDKASFGFIQGTLGIAPGWGGGTLLYQRIDPLRAYEMLVHSKRYNTEQLQEIGWLQGTYDHHHFEPELDRILSPILEKSTDQLKGFKDQYKKRHMPIYVSAEMDEEVRQCANLWGNDKHTSAVEQFLK